MANPEENVSPEEELEALRKSNAKLSRLLAISRGQVDGLKKQCVGLREALTDALSKKA